jgi:hypothetical protein
MRLSHLVTLARQGVEERMPVGEAVEQGPREGEGVEELGQEDHPLEVVGEGQQQEAWEEGEREPSWVVEGEQQWEALLMGEVVVHHG